MCFTKPAVPKPSALPPAPPAQGADSLILGGGLNQDDQLLRNQGVLGRLALMVGRGRSPGGAPAGSSTGGGTGSGGGGDGGSPSGGGSPSSPGGTSTGGSLSVGPTSGPAAGGDSGGSYYCVTVDTPILLANGGIILAGELEVGDLLHTRHEDTEQWGDFPVEAVEIARTQPLYQYGPLKGTANHRIWLNGEWRELDRLGLAAGFGDVVKLTVTDAHTYVSAGFLSHNVKSYRGSSQ